jgi:hypothetical protein
LAVVQLETPRDKSAGRKEAPVLELELELRPLVDPTSSRGSVALKADLRHGRSTGRAVLPTRRPGSNVLLLLDHLEDPLLGKSDLEAEVEAMAATANIAEEEIAAQRRGNSPEVVTTAMAATEVDMVDTVVVTEEEATDREVMVRPPEAQLPGSNRMLAMVLQAWTATAFHHLLRHLVESRHHRLLAISRRLHHPHRSSGLDLEPLEECVDGLCVLACGVLKQ